MQTTATAGSGSTAQRLAKSPYRPEIDGLRAFAVVAVIINHFNKDLLPSGYLGVDIFFVISGYVITSSLANHRSETFGDFFLGFYARRVKRLVPALVVFVLITSVLICLFNPEPGVSLGVGRRALFGISNINLYQASTDYFASSTELNPFTHTWSLGVEEQFYLLFPLLIWFSGFGRVTSKGERNLFWATLALSIASLIAFLYLYPTNQPAAYFLMPPRAWELGAGCLLFLSLHRLRHFSQKPKGWTAALVAACLLAALFIPLTQAVPATLVVVLLTTYLLACLQPGTSGYILFTQKKVVYIGLISYSLYLWHWGVLCISRWTIGIHWWSWPFQVAVTMMLCIASHTFIEKPLRSSTWGIKNWSTVLRGALLMLASSTLVLITSKTRSFLFLGDSPRGDQIYSETAHWNRKECMNYRIFTKLPSEMDFDNCWIGSHIETNSKSPRPIRRIFAYGNSYNEQLTPAYLLISNSHKKVAFNAYFASGCTASQHLSFSGETELGHCSQVFNRYINFFWKKSAPGDSLIIANSLNYFSESSAFKLYYANASANSNAALESYTKELKNLAKTLKKKGRNLVMISSIPVLKGNPDICSQWYAKFNNQCERDTIFEPNETSDNNRIGLNIARSGSGLFGYANIFEKTKRLINASSNPWNYYYNNGHLSKTGSIKVAGEIMKALGVAGAQ